VCVCLCVRVSVSLFHNGCMEVIGLCVCVCVCVCPCVSVCLCVCELVPQRVYGGHSTTLRNQSHFLCLVGLGDGIQVFTLGA